MYDLISSSDASNCYTKEEANKRFEFPIGFYFEWALVSGGPDLSTAEKVAAYFGYGTWREISGVFMLSRSASHAVGSTGGEETHTLTQSELPDYTIGRVYTADTNVEKNGDWVKTDPGNKTGFGPLRLGNNKPHQNMPPYLVCYRWQRIA